MAEPDIEGWERFRVIVEGSDEAREAVYAALDAVFVPAADVDRRRNLRLIQGGAS